jgi:hypothetical protein
MCSAAVPIVMVEQEVDCVSHRFCGAPLFFFKGRRYIRRSDRTWSEDFSLYPPDAEFIVWARKIGGRGSQTERLAPCAR